MTPEQINSLTTEQLRVIVRSTNPIGRFGLEIMWAKDELARRFDRRRRDGDHPYSWNATADEEAA